MGKAVFAACLLLAAMPAGAQQVILKCKGSKGETIYQNHPCAWRGGTIQDVLVFDDPPDSPEARRRLEAIERQQQARYQAERRFAGGAYQPPSTPAAGTGNANVAQRQGSAPIARRLTERRMGHGRFTSGLRSIRALGYSAWDGRRN